MQRGSDSGVVSPADRSVVVSRIEDDADGSDERMASTAAATRITATPPVTSQEKRVRSTLESTNGIHTEVPDASAALPQVSGSSAKRYARITHNQRR